MEGTLRMGQASGVAAGAASHNTNIRGCRGSDCDHLGSWTDYWTTSWNVLASDLETQGLLSWHLLWVVGGGGSMLWMVLEIWFVLEAGKFFTAWFPFPGLFVD